MINETEDGLVIPVVNINGTSKEELLEQYNEAINAIVSAIEAVGECRPHGRDYQTVDQSIYQKALDQWEKRMRYLHKICREYDDLFMELDRPVCSFCKNKIKDGVPYIKNVKYNTITCDECSKKIIPNSRDEYQEPYRL